MTKKKAVNSAADAAWLSRKEVLEEIASYVKEVKEEEILDAEQDQQVRDQIKALDEGWPATDRGDALWLWWSFQYLYARQQKEICRALLKPMMQFAENAAAFLGTYNNKTRYSRRYLWRTLLNQVSTDLRTLQAAIQQRPPGKLTDDRQSNTLFMADIISEYALEQAVENGFVQDTPIITYLKEEISVRPAPYTEAVMISVAYATMLESLDNGSDFQTVSRDLLAIPHEIGHHLFWKGQMPGKKRTVYKHMQKRLKRAQIRKWDWRRAWLEEIFADAFGCLVAGPVMALSFQELLTDNPPAQLKEDTGHHPIPALRPYIQTKILRAITDANGKPSYRLAPDRLDEKWEAWLADQEWADARKPLQVKYELHGVPHPLPGQQILEELDEIIKIVLRTLRGQRPSHAGANWNHGSWQAWTTDTHEDDVEMAGLYKSLTFEHFPPRSRWLRSPYVAGQASPPKNPEQILKGWSVEGPTRTGWG